MDLINRQQAIDAFNTNVDELIVAGKENADSVEKYLNRVIDKIKQLPSAESKSKMGKWIYHIDDLFPAESTMECNQCHAEQPLTCDDEFCPHCGAKMEVTE